MEDVADQMFVAAIGDFEEELATKVCIYDNFLQ